MSDINILKYYGIESSIYDENEKYEKVKKIAKRLNAGGAVKLSTLEAAFDYMIDMSDDIDEDSTLESLVREGFKSYNIRPQIKQIKISIKSLKKNMRASKSKDAIKDIDELTKKINVLQNTIKSIPETESDNAIEIVLQFLMWWMVMSPIIAGLIVYLKYKKAEDGYAYGDAKVNYRASNSSMMKGEALNKLEKMKRELEGYKAQIKMLSK